MRSYRSLLAAALLTTASACGAPAPADPQMVSALMHRLYGAVRVERLSPPVASRLFAYSGIALYEGMAAANPKLESLSGRLNGLTALPRDTSGRHDEELVALAAERTVLDTLFREALPTTRASLHQLGDSLVASRGSVDSATRARSEALGQRVGFALIAWAHQDGFDSTRGRKYVAPVGPGLWVNDSPEQTYSTQNLSGVSQGITFNNPANALGAAAGSDRALILDRLKRAASTRTLPAANMAGVTEPYWGHNRPFALARWDECPAPPPPAFSLTAGTPLYEEAKYVHDVGKSLTPAQKQTALYWADNAGESGTPAGHWLSIGAQMVSERHLTGEQAAWVMATTGISLADAFIAAWGYKFQLNLIRPRTFIRATMDSTWEPAIPTPPFPEYLSGHSTVSAAAAGTLTSVLGNVPFSDSTSVAMGHAVRHFASFRAAADEAGMSRIYGGIHFPSGNREGSALGRCVAGRIVQRLKVTPIS
jgi:PAP2 superfamily